MAEEGQAVAPAPAPVPAPTDIIGRLDAILAAEGGLSQTPPAKPPADVPAVPGEEAVPNKDVEGGEAPASAEPAHEISLDDLEAVELEVTTKGDDGKDVAEKLTVKALRDGYMKDADYRRKTAELARQREQLPMETRKAVEAERSSYVRELQTMHDLVSQTAAAELTGVDWNDLAQNNPFEYVRLDNRKKQITQALETIKSKQQEVTSKQQAEMNAAKRSAAVQARTQLEADIPGWNDALYESLMKTGIERFGYKPEEIVNWIDPRAIKLLYAAHENAKAKEAARTDTPAPAKRVVVVPRTLKPGSQSTSQGQQRHAAAMKQLQSDGKISSAAEVIRQRFGE